MRRFELALGAALFGVVLVALAGSRRYTRVAVSGHSMEPGLRDGDWLVVDRKALVEVGQVVVAQDPRERSRVIIKRVLEVGTDSQLMLVSDHPAHEGETIGPLTQSDVKGIARLRYWPPRRVGRID